MALPGTVTRILLSLCLSLLVAGTAMAQGLSTIPGTERRAIRSVIEAQISAFRADDGERAFSFAAPSIRGIFLTADNFMAMVRRGYEPVYRPRDVRFGDLIDVEQTLVQKVIVTTPDGKQVLALYSMERQSDGSWRISGCMLAEPDDEV
jgi:hypothetical protein